MTDSVSSVNVVSGFIEALQVSGSAYSVEAQSAAKGLNETTDGVLRTVVMTDCTVSANVVSGDLIARQISGSAFSVASQALGLNETTDGVLRAVLMTDSVSSIFVTGSSGTTVIVGSVVADAADTGDAPVKVGGIARTANPAAVAGGDSVSTSYDDLGRILTRPLQVRDLMATAYVSLATGSNFGTETTLLASGASTLLDLIYVMGTNDSDAAITANFRASTGGTVMMSLRIPANGTAGVSLTTPVLAPFADHTWTVDLPDVSGTNVTISALFTKEV